MPKKKTAPRPQARLKFSQSEKDRAFEIREQRNLQLGREIEAWACASAKSRGFKSTSAFLFDLIRDHWMAETTGKKAKAA